MRFNLTCSVCLALACLSAASTAKAQENDKPQYGSWGIDLSAMDPSGSRAMISTAMPQAHGLRAHRFPTTNLWLRCVI